MVAKPDVRDYVKKRKISGSTRSDTGRKCKDSFASLKKTCRKLGISFWQYLTDRHHENSILLLSAIRSEKLSRTTPATISWAVIWTLCKSDSYYGRNNLIFICFLSVILLAWRLTYPMPRSHTSAWECIPLCWRTIVSMLGICHIKLTKAPYHRENS